MILLYNIVPVYIKKKQSLANRKFYVLTGSYLLRSFQYLLFILVQNLIKYKSHIIKVISKIKTGLHTKTYFSCGSYMLYWSDYMHITDFTRIDGWTARQIDGQTGRQTYGWTDRQTDRWTENTYFMGSEKSPQVRCKLLDKVSILSARILIII